MTDQDKPAARRRAAQAPAPDAGPPEDPEPGDDDTDVAIDLLEEDAMLREAIREPAAVRLPTRRVIRVPHVADWPHIASRAAATDQYNLWAKLVLDDEDFTAFVGAELRNYQILRILTAANAAGDITPGKPRRSSGSRGGTRHS